MKRPFRDAVDIPVAEWLHVSRRWSLRDQGPTTICYADMCRYAEGCANRTVRPRRVAQGKCPRYWPDELRPDATLSRLVKGLLTQYRGIREQRGKVHKQPTAS